MAKARDIPGLERRRVVSPRRPRGVAVRAQELFDAAGDVLDTSDIERVHDMRVATRRLRAVLEIFAACFPAGELQGVLRDVKALADALGERRDPDVQHRRPRADSPRARAADRARLGASRATAARRAGAANEVLAEALAARRRTTYEGRLGGS